MQVTNDTHTEAALRAREERFRTLLEFSFDVYWETDAQHRFARQEFSQQLAAAPARGSEIGKTRCEVPCLEPDEEAWRKHRAALGAHLPFRDFELPRPTPDGGKRGVGLAPDARTRVVETLYTTKQSGLGMGLSISKSIVEAHGGRISATANAPHGVVFAVRLPLASEGTAVSQVSAS
jgi:PAS domain-containing protein